MTSETIKVLLIDIDEDAYIRTRALLSDVKVVKYELDWAPSYEEGLKVARLGQHHVCLVDYRLGERSGVHLIRETRESRLTTPMILFTGQGDPDVDLEAMQAGATAYLVKDETSPARLELTIRYAVQLNIERRRAEEALVAYAQRQAVVAEVGSLALIGGELKDLFAEAVSLVARTLGVEYCMVLELLPDGDELILRAALGLKEEHTIGQVTISAGKETQAGFTLLSDEPVIVEDWQTETRFSGTPLLREHGVMSGVSVIIRRRERPDGVLSAHSTSVRRFTTDDVNFLRAVANVLAEAIDRKQAEDEVRQSEARFRRVVESNMLGIISWTLGGEITEANDAFLKMVGYAREDLAAGRMRWTEMTPSEYHKLDVKALEDLAASGVCETYEKEYIRKDGSRVPILLGCATLEGEKQRGVGFVIDISDRKRNEESLRQSEAQFRALFENAVDAVLIADDQGVYVDANPAACDLLGVSYNEIIGRTINAFIEEDYSAEASRRWSQFLKEGRIFGEFRLQRPDGRVVEVDFTATAKFLPGRHFSMLRDVTERKRAEETLRQSEERYRLLFERNPQPMWAFDLETLAFLEVNDAAIHHYGYSREEFLAMTIKDIRPPQDIPNLLADISGVGPQPEEAGIISGVAPQHEEAGIWKHQKKDGTIIDVEIAAHELTLHGRLAQIVLAFDVTERRSLEEELRQSQKMEAVGRLAGGIAHDFNNLLTVINGYCELSLRRLKPEDALTVNLEEIRRAGSRAASLTRQLLAFSRKQVMQPKVIDLNTVISDLERMLQRLIGEDIDLRTALEPELRRVYADPGQIEQVIMNLVVNARDAMPDGGKLTIETGNVDLTEDARHHHIAVKPGPYALLAVCDDGSGMNDETKANIFEPFFTTKGSGKGTGLGLSTVFGIVKQSMGNIWVYSEEGLGTTFKIYLPSVDDEVDNRQPSQSSQAAATGTETILLVEDDEMVRGLTRTTLEEAGYKVLQAANGAEALLICEQYPEPIHLLLTDVVMPGMSGRTMSDRLRTLRPKILVLYMSGYTEDQIVHRGVLNEGVNFIEKPFAPAALARRVRKLLDA